MFIISLLLWLFYQMFQWPNLCIHFIDQSIRSEFNSLFFISFFSHNQNERFVVILLKNNNIEYTKKKKNRWTAYFKVTRSSSSLMIVHGFLSSNMDFIYDATEKKQNSINQEEKCLNDCRSCCILKIHRPQSHSCFD